MDILDKPLRSSHIRSELFTLHGRLNAIERRLGVTEPTPSTAIKDETLRREVQEILDEIDAVERKQALWQRQYKDSIHKLIQVNRGLPVHINAMDVHEHNINVDNIDKLLQAVEEDKIDLLDFFDGKESMWATAPYDVCFIQLENSDTFRKSIGAFYNREGKLDRRKGHLTQIFGGDEDQAEHLMHSMGLDEEHGDWDRDTFVLVQSFELDTYLEYVHLQDALSKRIGIEVKDTWRGYFNLQELFDRNKEQLKENWGADMEIEDFQFVQIFDIISKNDEMYWVEEQVLTWYDREGTPHISRLIEWNNPDIKDLDTTSAYYSMAIEKVFQWWNSENDLLEEGDLEVRPSWRKKVKKYSNKKKLANKSIRYKTLVVKPYIRVIDQNGVERAPLLREIAQHTRRGHWAHYGKFGNGKLFGKWTKSVYRRPKTIGKLANGLILKDYKLEENE